MEIPSGVGSVDPHSGFGTSPHTPVVVAAVLTIDIIPGARKADGVPAGIVKIQPPRHPSRRACEFPGVIKAEVYPVRR